MVKKKKIKKEEKQIEKKFDEIVKKESIGYVLELIADKENPIGDGKEYKSEEE